MVPELSSQTATTYRLPDGSFELEAATAPVNYRNPAGAWAPIDTDLVDASDSTYAVQNAAADYTVKIPQDAGNAPVRFGVDGAWVTMKLRGAHGAPVVDGSTATFENVAGADRVSYRAVGDGLKEDIVLDAPPEGTDPVVFSYDLATSPGVTPRLTDAGLIEFVDASRPAGDQVVFAVPAGNMVDTTTPEPAYSDAVDYRLDPKAAGGADGWTLTVTPDMGWLQDPARSYPVTIDPSVTVDFKALRSCWLQADNPTVSRCGSNATYLKVGRNTSGSRQRAVLDFDISKVPSNANITHANVNLYLDATQTTKPEVSPLYSMYRAGKGFGGGATWASSGTNGAWTGGDPTGPATGDEDLYGTVTGNKYFEVTPIVEGWLNGEFANTGLVLKQKNEDVNQQVAFYNSYAGASNRQPTMNVIYDEVTNDDKDAGDRPYFSYLTKQLTDQITAKANIGTGNLLIQADDASVAGVAGWDMGLTRYYNSATHRQGVARMGMGWSTGFGGSVRLGFPNGGVDQPVKVFFYGPSGYRTTFTLGAGGYVAAAPGITADLSFDDKGDTNQSNDEYTLKWFDESKYVFDNDGKLQRQVDPSGNKLTYTYNTLDELDYVTDTRNRRADLHYNANGLVDYIEIQKADGTPMLRWSYTYTTTTPALLATSQLSMVDNTAVGGTMSDDTTGNVGAVTRYSYDANDRLSKIEDARETATGANGTGGTTTFSYTGGKLTTLTRVTDDTTVPDSTTTFTYYDGAGPAFTKPNPDAQAACKSADQNAASRTFVDGERLPSDVDDTTRYCVDGNGRVVRTIDANLHERSNTWDANSNVTSADMSGLGDGTQQYDYTFTNNNPTKGTSPEGATSRASYDDTAHPHSATATKGDDSGGNDVNWNYTYDDDNRVITAKSATGAGQPGVEYRYCWTGNGQISRIDPVTATGTAANSTNPQKGGACNGDTAQGNDTLFTYNTAGELTAVDKPAGGDLSYTYDNLSRIKTVTDARGVTTSYTYDGLDHVKTATYTKSGATTQSVTWTYDKAGNLTAISDLNGANTFGYDELNRKTSESPQAPSGATTYAYDTAGNVKTITVAGQTINGSPAEPTRYTYDKVNNVATIDDPRPGAQLTTFDYTENDKRKKTVFPGTATGNDVIQEARYNKDGNPSCIYSYRQANAPANSADTCPSENFTGLLTFYRYGYTNPANSAVTDTKYVVTEKSGRTTTYDYDPIKRLTSATTRVDGTDTSTLQRKFDYAYDRHSNLTKQDVTGTTPGLDAGTRWQTFNTGDEICATKTAAADPGLTCASSGTGIDQYTHDADGNLTAITGAGQMSGTSLGYNLPGQTTSIQAPGASTADTMAYDGVMQDRRTQAGNTTMAYGYSGLTAQTTGGTTPHSETFVRDPAGRLIAMIDTTTGATRYYLTDDQQTVVATTNTTGGDVVRYLYEPYGNQIRSWTDPTAGSSTNDGAENSVLTAPTIDNNPWRYASGYRDKATGILKFGTRYYMPEDGTWTQSDPKNGHGNDPTSLNGYAYTAGNPINRTDASGRAWYDYLGIAGDAIDIGYELYEGDVAGAYASMFGVVTGGLTEAACTLVGIEAPELSVPGCYLLGSAVSEASANYALPYYEYLY